MRPPLPNFLLLGAAKSGTTSLYHQLGQHPDLLFSRPKEPVFFEAEWERGLDYYRQTYFSHWQGETAVGEARVYNLFLPYVPERVFEAVPGARLLAILRDPIDRAHSHWWHRTARGQEDLPFGEAVAAERRCIEQGLRFEGPEGEKAWRRGRVRGSTANRWRTYLALGEYAGQLERYFRLFGAERLRVLWFEELRADPARVIRELWRFLEIDPDVTVEVEQPQNVAASKRGPLESLARTIHRNTGIGRLLPSRLRAALRRSGSSRPAEKPPLDPEVTAELVDHFAPHNRALARLLGRDLPAWR